LRNFSANVNEHERGAPPPARAKNAEHNKHRHNNASEQTTQQSS